VPIHQRPRCGRSIQSLGPMEPFAAIGGFFIGLIAWNRAIFWLHSLWTVWKTEGNRFGTIAAAILLHSAPWLLGVAGVLLWVLRSNAAFPYFLGGMLAAPILVLVNFAFLLRRRRRAALKRGEVAP